MDKEPVFLFDRKWEEQENELKKIFYGIKNPKVRKNAFVLETFVRACSLTFVKKLPRRITLTREIRKPKYYERVLNIPVGTIVHPVPVPSITRKQPVQEFKEIPQYVKKVVKEPVKKKEPFKPVVLKKDLIKDKITGIVLAGVSVADKYILDEPVLDKRDVQVLEKVKKKKIKDMEKGWKLIVKYGKKFNIGKGHDTIIKYYVVNDLFGLGKIEPLLHDTEVTSIGCDGYRKKIVVIHRGEKLVTNLKFLNRDDMINYIQFLAGKIGKKIDKKKTSVDGMLRGYQVFLSLSRDLLHPKFTVRK